jgi:hypothetical protein
MKAELEVYTLTMLLLAKVTFSLDWYDSQNTTYYTIAETVDIEANSLLTDYMTQFMAV